MDVKDILVSARRAVDEAEIPDDLRSIAFGKAIDLIAGPRKLADGPSIDAASQGREASDQPGDGTLDLIAKKLELDLAVVDQVFDVVEGEVHVVVHPGKLHNSKKRGTEQVALLVAAGRQAAGFDDVTLWDTIRAVAEDFKRYDPPNFAKTINGMSDEFTQRQSGKSRAVKVSRPGWAAAKQLVNALGGGEV